MNTKQINNQLEKAFSNGVYLNITFHTGWMGSEKIPEEELKQRGLDTEIERGIRSLLLPEDYANYHDLRGLKSEVEKRFKSSKGKNWKADTIYSGIADLDLLPTNKVAEAYEYLTGIKDKVEELAEKWASCVSSKEKNFAAKYPQKYNPAKYPNKEDIKRGIVFEFSVHNVSLPSKEKLPEEVYNQEAKKVAETYRKAADIISTAFISEISTVIKKMRDGCTEEDKNVDSRVISKGKDLISKFKSTFNSFIYYKEIEDAVNSLEEFFEDDDPKELAALVRNDSDLKNLVGGMMGDIITDLKKISSEPIRRAIDF